MTIFSMLVSGFIHYEIDGEKKLAREFGVSRLTVQRWADGTANPHYKLKAIVIDWITKQTGEEENDNKCDDRPEDSSKG